jgi:uncharacterized membrane protein YfcA
MTWDLYNILLVNGIITIASIFQMVSGISIGIIITPFLALISYTLIPTPIIMASLVLTILMAVKYRKYIDTKSVYLLSFASSMGVVATIIILNFINTNNLNLLFGSLTLLAVLFSLKIKNIHLKGKFAFITGFISGCMGSLASVGGQLLSLLYQNHKLNTIKASLAFIYTIFSSFMLITFYYSGNLHYEQVISGLYMMPGFIIGFLISPLFISKFNSKYIKIVILSLSTLGGIILIIKHFYQIYA